MMTIAAVETIEGHIGDTFRDVALCHRCTAVLSVWTGGG